MFRMLPYRSSLLSCDTVIWIMLVRVQPGVQKNDDVLFDLLSKGIMENPTSWNDTQKIINQAVATKDDEDNSSDEYKDRVVVDVIAILTTNNLLKETKHNLEEVILEEIDLYYRLLARGNCGRSMTSRIYYKLVSIGAI